jgi:50S ribosomal protein 6|uniref:50S ribosomal protein 6, chloroplastic n=1 Tax=Fagus sylvatica TaxID=28930 RepID=A0A2N9IS12_FAGSY
MSISTILGTSVLVVPNSCNSSSFKTGGTKVAPWSGVSGGSGGGGSGLMIECSSRPQKKATAHHRKTRPRKTQAWDIKRKPAVYPPMPVLPPDWTLVPSDSADDSQVEADVAVAVASPSPSPPPPISSEAPPTTD